MTFSISGRCARTGMLGIAIASSSPSVAARCAFAQAGVGVCATQNITDPRLGPRGLALLESGMHPQEALDALRAASRHADYRQVGLLDSAGRSASYCGAHALGLFDAVAGADALALGNLLATIDVPRVMIEAFEGSAAEHLGDRLLQAMRAGLAAGGEAGPVRSAGMILVDAVPWPVADLRVDWHDAPIDSLGQLWAVWRPQMDAYVTRALHPDTAPAFGVAGDP